MTIFDKALKTMIGSGEQQKMYLLPYTGNLTEAKYLELAERLDSHLLHAAPAFWPASNMAAVEQHLRSEWRTGREKNVLVEENKLGNIDVSGPGWSSGNYPKDRVVILKETTHG